MPVKAVLFDMDGVLIDARDWHYEALNRALSLFGYVISRDEHLTTFDGLPTRKKLEILTQSRRFPRKLHDFVNALKQDYTAELAHACCRPTFHHRFALSRLKARGIKVAVCSNSVRQSVALMMSLSRLDEFIDVMLSNEDVQQSKPHPEIYLTAMDRLSVAKDEVLIVEDNENGIRAARAAGAHVMVVGSPLDVTYDRIEAEIAKIERVS